MLNSTSEVNGKSVQNTDHGQNVVSIWTPAYWQPLPVLISHSEWSQGVAPGGVLCNKGRVTWLEWQVLHLKEKVKVFLPGLNEIKLHRVFYSYLKPTKMWLLANHQGKKILNLNFWCDSYLSSCKPTIFLLLKLTWANYWNYLCQNQTQDHDLHIMYSITLTEHYWK